MLRIVTIGEFGDPQDHTMLNLLVILEREVRSKNGFYELDNKKKTATDGEYCSLFYSQKIGEVR